MDVKTARADVVKQFEEAQRALVLQNADLALRTVATMADSGAIDLAPQFQRRDRWSPEKQSSLIESFLLNIPIPPVYLAEESLGRFAVIDGKQRISAVRDYLSGDLALRGLAELKGLEGARFDDLPVELKGNLDLRPLRSVTLLQQSAPHLKYVVFHRLNTGGEVLNAQELRNVVFRGPLNDLIYTLAGNKFLLKQIKAMNMKSPAYRNMQDADWTLRFLTLSETWRSFSGDLAASMDQFMDSRRTIKPSELAQLQKRFKRAIAGCADLWGDNAFRRPDNNVWRDQALAGMYDAEMVAVNELTDSELRKLKGKSAPSVAVKSLFDDPQFDASVRQATNTPSRVKYRITQLLESLRQAAA